MQPPAHMTGTALTGTDRPRYAFGMRNRMDERYDMVRTVRDQRFRYLRNFAPHRPWGSTRRTRGSRRVTRSGSRPTWTAP
ncbi:hypothetical protein [Actinoplanes couchii]|uniref:hypothetical protein n=1 Tax=Actinoplanes couchii TaxID=403638 RepID=UPI00194382C7|nr:hypothetical protein [Actinoplanes couchii]